jgi:hypothetical protein
MSKLVKIVVILAVAAVAIAAKQFTSTDKAALSMAPASSISPAELTHRAGQLPELKIENLF